MTSKFQRSSVTLLTWLTHEHPGQQDMCREIGCKVRYNFWTTQHIYNTFLYFLSYDPTSNKAEHRMTSVWIPKRKLPEPNPVDGDTWAPNTANRCRTDVERCDGRLFTERNNFFLKISSFCFVNSKNVFTFVHSSKFIDYGMKIVLSQAVKPRMTLSA